MAVIKSWQNTLVWPVNVCQVEVPSKSEMGAILSCFSGQVLLKLFQIVKFLLMRMRIKCLAQRHNALPRVHLRPQILYNTLPLSHRALEWVNISSNFLVSPFNTLLAFYQLEAVQSIFKTTIFFLVNI